MDTNYNKRCAENTLVDQNLLMKRHRSRHEPGMHPEGFILLAVIIFPQLAFRVIMAGMAGYLIEERRSWPVIDLFRGACAVKGNVQVAGHVKPAPFSRRDVTLGDVDGSLFHIKI